MAKEDSKETKNSKHFFKNFKAELKKVVWPTPKQVINNTIAVIIIVIITTAIVFILDTVFEVANKYGINKLKQNIKNSVSVEENAIEENTAETVPEEVIDEATETEQENSVEE